MDDSEVITITVTDVIEGPSPPIVRATLIGDDSVKVTWGPSDPGDDFAAINHYRVQYRKAGASRWDHTRKITGTSVVIDHLTPGTYQFRGIAIAEGSEYDLQGWSNRDLAPIFGLVVPGEPDSPSQESEPPTSAATQAPEPTATPRTERPGKPTILSVTAGSGSITVSWGPADGADGYALHYDRTDVRSDWQVAANAVTGTAHTITDLDPGTYRIRLRAVNERGTSKWAREKRITVR